MIPSGSVTFLFTDIEGSTKLAQKNNDAYLAALDKHHEVLYEVIDSNNGFVFKIIGDSFCCAFSNSTDAVNAAIKSQIKLKSIDWKDTEIKVRMGIHSGEAEFINKDYSGYVTLSRSQRIMSVAYGEQILITQEVFDILKENHETEFSFKDFGERKLKDIIKPEHIYQIVSEGLRTDFPPLKSLDARQNNLPTLVSQFVGRRKEIDEIKQLFTKIRLLSLTGAGGTGKTRLAIQLASELIDEFENGIWIIEFSPVTDPDLIDGLQALRDFLKNKSTLLIFDNCEHLLNRCAQVSETLLSYCTKLKIISTSRESFNIQGETLYRIPPLSMPENIKKESFESLIEYESVKLFLDRAVSVNPKFTLTKENIYAVASLGSGPDMLRQTMESQMKSQVGYRSVNALRQAADVEDYRSKFY